MPRPAGPCRAAGSWRARRTGSALGAIGGPPGAIEAGVGAIEAAVGAIGATDGFWLEAVRRVLLASG
jgi:hypothetical protein